MPASRLALLLLLTACTVEPAPATPEPEPCPAAPEPVCELAYALDGCEAYRCDEPGEEPYYTILCGPDAQCSPETVRAAAEPEHACAWAWDACETVSECVVWTASLDYMTPEQAVEHANGPAGAGHEFVDLVECVCPGGAS